MSAFCLKQFQSKKCQGVVFKYQFYLLNRLNMEDSSPLDDYSLMSVIGKGSYAKVILVRKKSNSHLYAIKSMKKKYIEKKGQAKRIMMERDILTSINHPFLIKIHASFQDQKKLFLVLQYCPGGQLFGLLSKRKRLLESEARFFAAQVLVALEYLHSKNIIYRDLKPENILIGSDGYIKLTDFGLSKNNILTDHDTFSVCGTPEYLAPQVIKKQGHGKAVDWWCLGSLIYELIHGLPPFYSKNRSQLFDKIKHNQPYLNKNWSNDLKDLFGKLFEKKAEQRLQNIANLKQHPWFSTINWEYLIDKKIKPTFIPQVGEDNGLRNFDQEFTTCSIQSNASSFTECKKFEGFSFENSKSPHSPQLTKMEAQPFDSDQQIVFAEEKRHQKIDIQ